MKKINLNTQGRNGKIEFEVDIEKNKIKDLKIINHMETPGIFNQVFSKLKSDVISNQSFDVDTISGATIMTKSILDTAKEAITDNGIHLNGKKSENTQVQKKKEIVTDTLVIGGGGAGLVAASKALSLGSKVILLEKNGYLGGATILNGSNVVGTGSKTSKKIFESDYGDSPGLLAKDVSKESRQTNYTDLTKIMVENIGNAIDFVSDFANLDYRKAQTQTPEHSVERQIELPSSSSYEFIDKMAKAFFKKGGEILLDVRVENMTIEKNMVKGVIAESKYVSYYIKAKSVILASGGYGAKVLKEGKGEGIDYYGPMTSTGDSYQFTHSLSLKAHDQNWLKVYPHGVEVEPGIAKLTTYASKMATDMGAIYVNKKGQRIVNESDVYTKLRDAILEQSERIAYLIMDERTWKEFYKLLVLHDFSKNEIKEYLKNDGSKIPIFVKGSLEKIANKANIDEQGLIKTLEKYEEYAVNEEDPEFGRAADYLHSFEGSIFYAVEQRDRFATTLGGYIVDEKMNLLNSANRPIKNLFGAGEIIGGANGHDSMPSMMNSWSFSSGFAAGRAAIIYEDKM
ncbi:FAD-dependent oxidoreductase [Liquorilactobacillus mali]|uniref:Urocanate reductase n=1 Tax=Liquorilactobacillus mali KCTC 3596 = DSM 20444 TaxID=1046596 RepID=J1F3H4_9LACO|nr:FAD-dependent oxidoreductase [Liquorilactobacillus mali]EJE99957.1 fumarate reductase, flavoprotein subunit [Liquorilactobacillus mali KCTC 3596 = DSM 20444]KRN11256.1 fumarate reductase, flavoprotein subunit precursor [Liquorilactobacillus mali KCTC 3596 = DSM 20444]QFQ73757.1 FAD-dependent oxidoreductase [Liquorilactobacillus mali]